MLLYMLPFLLPDICFLSYLVAGGDQHGELLEVLILQLPPTAHPLTDDCPSFCHDGSVYLKVALLTH